MNFRWTDTDTGSACSAAAVHVPSIRSRGGYSLPSFLDISLLPFFRSWYGSQFVSTLVSPAMSQAAAQPFTGGDDLDDGLDVAPEYIQSQAHDGDADVDIHHSDVEADANGFFSEDEDDVRADDASADEREEDTEAQVGQKRKATAGEKGVEGSGAPLTDLEKKKKRKVKAKERSEKVGKDTHHASSFSRRPPVVDLIMCFFVAAQSQGS
jgi:hypothetical protein